VNHTPFIVIAYAVFALLLLIDGIWPWAARHAFVHELASRLKREKSRGRSGANASDHSGNETP